ncbi:hypothetical protein C8P68_105196 [Mucilaginibacter yixingensis]|uniref:Peptidase M1 membrane alanine aminopeptidase domain-containing protein n=1 Tax=Mucilaginibacter yixingensis TaxID=1295612 RepID=A0A2T5J8G8_9SPHI|nr:M1 family metallopeptidase [Mucilaginibacter yixingensis]PTQ95689.1 hypothetical protein C8P68_105196 [Mucilaginibacter yixingensis]
MRKILLLTALCGAFTVAHAQTLTIPPGIAKTYENGTRLANGKPGKTYWQNHGRYDISVNVAPPNKMVKGVEQITYFNNSPDTLKELNMKLIVNIHTRPQRRGADAKPEFGITVDDFKVNGAAATWQNAQAAGTNYMVPLGKPLLPKDSVKLDIKWHYQLAQSKSIDREGTLDSTSFFIAYFYPRVAVYDDYKGWDIQPHTGDFEFYNDFNDYALHVTVPKNFIVWATGTFKNPDEVLQPEFAQRLKRSMADDSTVHIVTTQDLAGKHVTAQNATNTWTFTAKNIPDMTVALSDHYVWDGASIAVHDVTKRRASVQAAYIDSAKDLHHSVQFSRYALDWFSHNWPGIPYPYEKSIAIQGLADMEYPMMVNDSPQDDLKEAQSLQDHEQSHTYMPFYMGINESYYAFMDEGWATTFEYLIGISERGQEDADKVFKKERVERWIKSKHNREDPIITPSPDVKFPIGDNPYGKPALSYLALKDMLGDNLFKKALHYYMVNWHGKHPIPWDFFNGVKAATGKNLDWFFYNWFYTKSYNDLNLAGAQKEGNDYILDIKNVGGFVIPFDVVVSYTDGSKDSFHQTPLVWEKDQKEINLKVKAQKAVKEIRLDNGIFMDANEADNSWIAGS